MPTPLISIIIPTLNEEKYLPHLISDLQAQTFQEFEVVIVDAGSTDDTQAVVKKSSTKKFPFHLLVCPKRNVSIQRNMGAARTSAPWLLFIDADTRLPATYLEDLAAALGKKDIDAFTTFAIPDTDKFSDKLLTSAHNALSVGVAWMKKPYAFGACLGCSRKAFELVHGFDEHVSFQEDADLLQRIVKIKLKFEILPEPVYIFCMRRYKKEGTLNVILKTIPYSLSSFTKQKFDAEDSSYPMTGGTSY